MYHKDAKTKIIATIGPASESEIKLKALINHGVDIFRLNFKHNTVDWHSNIIDTVRNLKQTENYEVGQFPALMLDLQGPSIRLILSSNSTYIVPGKPLTIVKNPVTPTQISFTYPNLDKYLKNKDVIYADDGQFKFIVNKTSEGKTLLMPQDSGELVTRKSVNLPGIYNRLHLPPLTKRDIEGLKLALLQQVELIAVSFVRSIQDILYVHQKIAELKKSLNLEASNFTPQIISKIETVEALNNLEEIILASDGIMVARGDLAIEAGFYTIPYYQAKIIETANFYNRPVIIATQMLKSMTTNFLPTRAEITDVGHAVENRVDAIMFSEETAIGKHPTRVIEVAQKILGFTEKKFDDIEPIKINLQDYTQSPLITSKSKNKKQVSIDPATNLPRSFKNLPDFEPAEYNLSTAAYHLYIKHAQTAKAFIVFSKTGKKATYLSKYKPNIPIYTFVPNKQTYGITKLAYNVFPILYPQIDYTNITESNINFAIDFLKNNTKILKPNTHVIAVYNKQLNKNTFSRALEIIPITL